jgi:hypothetical protein
MLQHLLIAIPFEQLHRVVDPAAGGKGHHLADGGRPLGRDVAHDRNVVALDGIVHRVDGDAVQLRRHLGVHPVVKVAVEAVRRQQIAPARRLSPFDQGREVVDMRLGDIGVIDPAAVVPLPVHQPSGHAGHGRQGDEASPQ